MVADFIGYAYHYENYHILYFLMTTDYAGIGSERCFDFGLERAYHADNGLPA